MGRVLAAFIVAINLFSIAGRALAGNDDTDLDRIPQNSTPAPVETPRTPQVIYLQTDLTLSAIRNNLAVPLPPPASPKWEVRTFLDTRLNWQFGAFSLVYSGRLNVRVENGLPFPSHENVRNDLREAYASWQNNDGFFLEFGRINLKNGVAVGFNPTDFFKTRAVVEAISADPTALREDRLGTVMLLAQQVWAGGSVTLAVAPKLASETPPYTNSNLPSFNPTLDRTNAHIRALIKTSFDLFDDLSSEFLIYEEAGQSRIGLNLTNGIGDAIVTYLEWSGGNRTNLVDNAFRDGRQTRALPPTPVIPVSAVRRFTNDLAVGASYTMRVGITFNLEYDRHETAFSDADWRNWFSVGAANRADPLVLGELWFIRSYAADQQEPVARNALFLRADWPDAFVRNLHLTSFVDTDLRDGSSLVQFTTDYFVSSQWTIGGLVDVNFGSRRSDFGSLPDEIRTLVKVTRYF